VIAVEDPDFAAIGVAIEHNGQNPALLRVVPIDDMNGFAGIAFCPSLPQ
jgi:hypothetical protein